MDNNKKAVKAGIGYTIGNYLINGLQFLTIPIFARLMSTNDYGLYNTFVAYQSFLFVCIGLAIHSSYKNARFKYGFVDEHLHKGYDYESYASSSILMIIIISSFLLIICNLFNGFISNILGLDLLSINMLVLFSFSSAIVQCFNSDVSLTYSFKEYLGISGINAITNILLSLILMIYVFNTQRYIGRVLGTTLSIMVIAIAIIIRFFKRRKPSNFFYYMKWGVSYSLPIVPHGISQIILSQFDRIMINNMVSSSTAGIYSFAYNIFVIIQVTYNSLDAVWGQWFYEKLQSNKLKEIRKTSSLYILLMFIFSSIMIFISPEVILILGGSRYYASVYCVIPIIGGGFFSFLYLIPASVEYYYEKTKLIAVGTSFAAVINIVLNFICIKKFGYIAASYTTLFTYFIYFLFHYFIARRIQGQYLFSNTVIIIACIGIILDIIIGIKLLEFMIIRWIIAILIGILFVVIEEYKYSFIITFIKNR